MLTPTINLTSSPPIHLSVPVRGSSTRQRRLFLHGIALSEHRPRNIGTLHARKLYDAQRKLVQQVKGPYFAGEEFGLVDVAIAPRE